MYSFFNKFSLEFPISTRYFIIPDVTQTEAFNQCRDEGGQLAMPKRQDIHDHMEKWLDQE